MNMFSEEIFQNVMNKINKKPFFIGVVGMSASGKSSFSERLQKYLKANNIKCIIIKGDNYQMDNSYVKPYLKGNYDVPEAIDLKLLETHFKKIKDKETISQPIYDFEQGYRSRYNLTLPADVIIVDSLFCMIEPIVNYLDFKIYIDANPEVCFERRKQRDVEIRKIPLEKVKWRWECHVIKGYENYILPNKNNADLIIDNN